jgi:hypothetical protein
MAEDPQRSLDAFAGADSEPPDADEDQADEQEPSLRVEPASPTYSFSPEGAACGACGQTARIRWESSEAELVCAACKPWE